MRRLIELMPALLLACSGGEIADESDEAEGTLESYGVSEGKPTHGVLPEAEPGARVTHHGGPVLPAMELRIVYVGEPYEGGAASHDAVFRDILGDRAYWGLLAQYGVGPGSVTGSVRIPTASLLGSKPLEHGLLSVAELEEKITELLHPKQGAGLVPRAQAYAIFLPDGVNVSFGNRGSKVFKSCVDVGAYHRHDGTAPYAVFPPCELGRSARAISHELVEMATDPIVGTGWFSDADQGRGVGEIADLCNRAVTIPVAGHLVTELWSNRDARCMP